ncbi:hypothetical protein [Chromobacterium sp. IIBBL 290-4]|uniref:hypothetical protein n=1 Tax=Chromobacterium sp. IIBBL 290-4 TaxID=2953890 RepID=UPI0020B87E50|nr:hypothetical protein [Chromobacterium sp. IIBBL 290-4]UTH73751.1 hypothetical protein NKT35_19740 [Chromobacterium sp. IIBBL 290-4]
MSDIDVFPLAGWDLYQVKGQPYLLFRPSFIANPMQPLDQPIADRTYGMTPAVARELGEKLLAQARLIESVAETADGHPQH